MSIMTINKPVPTGIAAEEIARFYLYKKGYEIIAANYKRQWGEIDIIAQKDGVTVFCEVKGAVGVKSGSGFEPHNRVNTEKRERIVRIAEYYLRDRGRIDTPWQIDVLSVILDRETKKARILHFKNI